MNISQIFARTHPGNHPVSAAQRLPADARLLYERVRNSIRPASSTAQPKRNAGTVKPPMSSGMAQRKLDALHIPEEARKDTERDVERNAPRTTAQAQARISRLNNLTAIRESAKNELSAAGAQAIVDDLKHGSAVARARRILDRLSLPISRRG